VDSRVAEVVRQFAALIAVGGTWCVVALVTVMVLHRLLPKAKPHTAAHREVTR